MDFERAGASAGGCGRVLFAGKAEGSGGGRCSCSGKWATNSDADGSYSGGKFRLADGRAETGVVRAGDGASGRKVVRSGVRRAEGRAGAGAAKGAHKKTVASYQLPECCAGVLLR